MDVSVVVTNPEGQEKNHPWDTVAWNKPQKGTTHAANYQSDKSTCTSLSEKCSGQESPEARATERLEARASWEACMMSGSHDTGTGSGESGYDEDAMHKWRARREARQKRKKENNKATYGDMAKACFMSNNTATMDTIEEVLANRGLPIVNLEMLGQGTFARVHKGQWTRDNGNHGLSAGSEVAVKIIKQRHCWQVPKWLAREVSAGKRHAHDNLVSMYEAFIEAPPCVLVLEYCGGGSLHELIHNCKGEMLSPKMGAPPPASTEAFTLAPRQNHKIALDVATGMAYLHSQCLVHRDLKPENVLLAQEVTDVGMEPLAKVGDFGLARFVHSEDDHATKMTLEVGSVQYMAPEVFLGDGAEEVTESSGRDPYTEKVDVYSYAMLLFELLSKRSPFDSDPGMRTGREDVRKIGLFVVNGWRPKEDIISEQAPDVLKHWMRCSWAGDPECRPGFEEVATALMHAYNKQTLCCL